MIHKIASTNWIDAGDLTQAAEARDLDLAPGPDTEPGDPAPPDTSVTVVDTVTAPHPVNPPDVIAELDGGGSDPATEPPTPPPPPPPDVPTPAARAARPRRRPGDAAPPPADPAVAAEVSGAHRNHSDTKKPARTRSDRRRTSPPPQPERAKAPTSKRRRLASLAITALLIGAWSVTLRPTWMGGPASVLTVRGISMEPTYEYGDIVIAHRSSTYTVGDVVAFRVPEGAIGAGTVVIHRIVGGDATTGFITQGDNNPNPDEWLPVPSDILGVTRFHIPAIGKLAALLRTIPGIALVAGLLAALIVFFGTEGSSERRAERRTDQATGDRAASEPPVCPGADLEPAPVVFAELTLEVAADRVAIEPIPHADPFEDLITPPPPPTGPRTLTTDPSRISSPYRHAGSPP